MSKKPTYTFDKNEFYPIKNECIFDLKNNKRYKLTIELKPLEKNKKSGDKTYLIILKNPSKAGAKNISISDKTVSTVARYFHKNELDYNKIIIMNLFPVYGTDSTKLYLLDENKLYDNNNINYIKTEIKLASKIVLAWGSHPVKCKDIFEKMKNEISESLKNKKNIFVMKRNGITHKNPLHGQVWGYDTDKYKLEKVEDISQYINI